MLDRLLWRIYPMYDFRPGTSRSRRQCAKTCCSNGQSSHVLCTVISSSVLNGIPNFTSSHPCNRMVPNTEKASLLRLPTDLRLQILDRVLEDHLRVQNSYSKPKVCYGDDGGWVPPPVRSLPTSHKAHNLTLNSISRIEGISPTPEMANRYH